jgi:ribosomal protein S16
MLKAPEIKTWIGNGALPSDTVRSLLQKAMVIPTPVRVVAPVKVVVAKEEPKAKAEA